MDILCLLRGFGGWFLGLGLGVLTLLVSLCLSLASDLVLGLLYLRLISAVMAEISSWDGAGSGGLTFGLVTIRVGMLHRVYSSLLFSTVSPDKIILTAS